MPPEDSDLDPTSSVPDSAPNGFDELVGSVVGFATTGGAAGDDNGIAGAENAGPYRLAFLDSLFERNRRGAAVTRRSDRRHAGQKRLASVIGDAESKLRILLVGQLGGHLARQCQAEVYVHIREAGHEPHAVGTNHFRSRGNPRTPRWTYRGDPLGVDHHDGISDRGAAVEVDHARSHDDLDLRVRRLRRQKHERCHRQYGQDIVNFSHSDAYRPEARLPPAMSLR